MKLTLLSVSAALLMAAPAFSQESIQPIKDSEARKLLSTFKKTFKKKRKKKDKAPSLKDKLTAVQSLSEHSNKMFIKPLLRVATSDKAKTVRQAAITGLGAQPAKRARPALLGILKKADVRKDPGTAAALVRAIGKSVYTNKDWKPLQKMFQVSVAEPKAADAHRAILEVAGQQKEVAAVRFLMQHIDAPAPAWVDDPSNPPASYWKARHENWQKWKKQVVESLFQITGQRFANGKEAREWYKANGKKLTSRRGKSRRKKKSKRTP